MKSFTDRGYILSLNKEYLGADVIKGIYDDGDVYLQVDVNSSGSG